VKQKLDLTTLWDKEEGKRKKREKKEKKEGRKGEPFVKEHKSVTLLSHPPALLPFRWFPTAFRCSLNVICANASLSIFSTAIPSFARSWVGDWRKSV